MSKDWREDCDNNRTIANSEKYYWEKEDSTLVPVHLLTDLHICHIVMKFGKDRLDAMGHTVIVDRFNELNKTHKFFDVLRKAD